MTVRSRLDVLALLLLGLSWLWFVEPAPAPGLQGGSLALLGGLLLAWPHARTPEVQGRLSAVPFVLLAVVVLLDISLRRLPYAGQSLPYLACLLSVVLLLLRPQPLPALSLAKALTLAAAGAALLGWWALLAGNPVIAGRMYLLAAEGSVRGPLQQPNLFATQLLLGVVALAYWRSQGLRGAAWWSGLLLLAPMVALTLSRTGLVNGILLLVLGAWFAWRKLGLAKPLLLAGGALLLAQLLTMPLLSALGLEVGSALGRAATASTGYLVRLDLLKRAWMIFVESPLLGVGLGGLSWQDFLLRVPEGHRYAAFMPQFDHSHNIVLQLLAEAGLLGGAAVALLLLVFARALFTVKDDGVAMALASLTVLWGHSQFEFPLWYMHFLLVFALLYAQLDPGKTLPSQFALLLRGVLLLTILAGGGCISSSASGASMRLIRCRPRGVRPRPMPWRHAWQGRAGL